jgi:hypothetical protein
MREYEMFRTGESYLLYLRALDWCIEESERTLGQPAEWVIPVAVVNGWNQRRAAKALVDANIWRRSGSGFHFEYVADPVSPPRVATNRKRSRERQARKRDSKRHPAPQASSEELACPRGVSQGGQGFETLPCPRGDRQ